MATFTQFSDILPDPSVPLSRAGTSNNTNDSFNFSAYEANYGPGFSAVGFGSNTSTQFSRTMSGRGVTRDNGTHFWEFTISYNPMFKWQFNVIDAFLSARNPRKDPFYVVLPQYSQPLLNMPGTLVDPFPTSNITTYGETLGTPLEGDSRIYMKSVFNTDLTEVSGPRPGDAFTIKDVNDFNHQKVYKITRVETNGYYQAGTVQPPVGTYRVHIQPPLQRRVTQNSLVIFDRPKFRVVATGDVQEYQINNDGLYSYSLPVTEIQP